MVISRSITRNLRSTVFSLHRQELMAVTTLLPVYKQWGKPTVRGNNIFPIPFPNSALAITSAGIGGWHTVDVSIVNNNSYSVLGWATDSPSTARTSLPNVIAIGF